MEIRRRIAVTGLITALTAAAFTGIAAASRNANRQRELARAAPAVKILDHKTLFQTATLASAPGALLTVAGVSHRALCKDKGGGEVELVIQMRATTGAIALTPVGGVPLTGQFKNVFNVVGSDPIGFAETYDVRLASGTVQRYSVNFAVVFAGKDCSTSLTRYSG